MNPQASDGKQRWTKEKVEQQVDVRSYAVRTEDGRLFRRNRRHLRQSKEPFMPKDADVEIPSPILNSPPTTASTETVSGGENSAGCPTALSRKRTESGPSATCPAPLAECQWGQWLLRHTDEPQKGRNSCLCLQSRSVLSSFGVVLMSCRVNFHVVRSALQYSACRI